MRIWNYAILMSVLLALSFVWSCNTSKDGMEYLLEVENDKDLSNSVTIGAFEISSYFRPTKYLAMRELIKHGNIADDTTGLEQEMQKYRNAIYFDVRIQLKNRDNIIIYGLHNQTDYAQRIDYLNNGIYNDFYLITEAMHKIKPIGHCFQNTFGAGNSCDISLVFSVESIEASKKLVLVYQDRIFGINNRVYLPYTTKCLKSFQN